MTFKCTQSPGAQSIFCGISFGKKPINNKLFEEMGKLYMHSFALTSDKNFQWEKIIHITLEWLQLSSKEKTTIKQTKKRYKLKTKTSNSRAPQYHWDIFQSHTPSSLFHLKCYSK